MGKSETFYLLVGAPSQGTPEEIRKYVERMAADIVQSDKLELVLDDGGDLPRAEIPRDALPGVWDDGTKAAFVPLRIHCPGKIGREFPPVGGLSQAFVRE